MEIVKFMNNKSQMKWSQRKKNKTKPIYNRHEHIQTETLQFPYEQKVHVFNFSVSKWFAARSKRYTNQENKWTKKIDLKMLSTRAATMLYDAFLRVDWMINI